MERTDGVSSTTAGFCLMVIAETFASGMMTMSAFGRLHEVQTIGRNALMRNSFRSGKSKSRFKVGDHDDGT